VKIQQQPQQQQLNKLEVPLQPQQLQVRQQERQQQQEQQQVRIQQQQLLQQEQLEQQQPVVRTLKKSQKLALLEQLESRRTLQPQKVEKQPQKVEQNNNYRT
jgi:hypothetical protein